MESLVFTGNWIEERFGIISRDSDRIVLRGQLSDARGAEISLLAEVAPHGAAHHAFERLLRSYRVRNDLSPQWAVEPIRLREEEHALLLSDPGGELVSQFVSQSLSVDAFLQLGIAIATAVERMHSAGILHQDIRPDNLLFDRATQSARLFGFGQAAGALGSRSKLPPGDEIAIGSLPYMAPEHTGRLQRRIDERSDLYSVGVTLYELLTGQLPFRASDPMEWVHAHMAKQPLAPAQRRHGIPLQVSAIVMKLLEKAPEARYPDASSLRSDLERCLSEWRSAGAISEFPTARAAAHGRLVLSNKLYGRNPELGRLRAAIDGVVRTGERQLVLVAGYSGTGKSTLIGEALGILRGSKCFVAHGKFDQFQRDIPYGALAQAFRGLVRDLLGRPDDELQRWRSAAAEALGPNARLLLDIVPEIEHLVGAPPRLPELPGPEARRRFLRVVRDLVGVFARPEHPLVLVLDDLQWLDAATLEVFTTLATHPTLRHLALIGSFRSNDAMDAPALAESLRASRQTTPPPVEISLAGIGARNVIRLIADATGARRREISGLAACVLAKCDDNPFFVLQFLGSLVDNGLLTYDSRQSRWQWDEDQIRMQEATGSVVDLMINRLKRLSSPSLHAVQAIACVGSRIDARKLQIALGIPGQDEQLHLDEAASLGLLIKFEDGYGFAHDRVHEAAYEMIPAPSRAVLHYEIGCRMIANTPADDLETRLFDIADQFNRSDPSRWTPDGGLLVARLNLRAARKARRSSAYKEASNLLQAGLRALSAQSVDLDGDRELKFELGLELAECTFLHGDVTSAESMVGQLLSTAATALECAAAYRLKVELHVVKSENAEAVNSSLRALRLLGIDLTPQPSDAEVHAVYDDVMERFSRRPLEGLAELPPMTDPQQLAAMRLLAETWPPAYFTNFNLTVIVICRMVELSLAYGSSAKSNQGYALLGWLMGPVSGRYHDGYRLAAFATQMAARSDSAPDAGRTCDTMALTSAWTRPLDESITWARQAFGTLREAGDIYFACYSLFHAAVALFMRGQGLRAEADELRHFLEFTQEIGFRDGYALIATYERTVACLRGETRGLTDFSDDTFDGGAFEAGLVAPRMNVAIQCYWTMKTMLHYLDGEPGAALAASERFHTDPYTQIHIIRHLDYHFYTGLAVAAAFDTAPPTEKPVLRTRLSGHHDVIRKWAEQTGASVFADRHLLLRAEAARLDGEVLEAERLYELSAHVAQQNGFKQNEALACELASRFHRARGLERMADAYLRDAAEAYGRWGARGKVRQLLRAHAWLSRPHSNPLSAGMRPGPKIDPSGVLRKTPAVRQELGVDQLVATLIRTALEQAGAQRAALLLLRDETLLLAAEAQTLGDAVNVCLHHDQPSHNWIPESVTRFVVRTNEALIVEDCLADTRFASDHQVVERRVRSILCLPVVNQSKLQAVLYLENNLAPRVFTDGHLEVLSLLSLQATMSLENARLYADIEAREAKIRRIFDLNVIGIVIWNLSGQLLDANDAFLRMVGHTRSDMEGGALRWYDMTPPEWQAQVPREVQELAETGALRPVEKEFFHKDGTRIPVLMGAATFEGKSDEGVAVIVDLRRQKVAEARAIDVERRNRMLQAELAHANRVATMGHLAAWIAHDVRQPLAGIVTSGDAAVRWLSASPPNIVAAVRAMQRLIADGMRAGEILDRTRALVKRATPQAEVIDVNAVIRDTVALVATEASRKGVTLRSALAPYAVHANVDRVQIQQVILNLLMNALDALDQEARNGQRIVEISSVLHGTDGVVVAVSDNGPGLSPAAAERCFEAFYTTKADGLGMGLAICRSIVQSFGGRISASTAEPQGARFTFTLPVPECPQRAAVTSA